MSSLDPHGSHSSDLPDAGESEPESSALADADAEVSGSLAGVPRTLLIVGSTALLVLLTFLTLRVLQEDEPARDAASPIPSGPDAEVRDFTTAPALPAAAQVREPAHED